MMTRQRPGYQDGGGGIAWTTDKAPGAGNNSLEEGMEYFSIIAAHGASVHPFDQGLAVKHLSHVTVGSSPGQRVFWVDPVGPPPSK